MTPFSYAEAPTAVRADIGAAHRQYWRTLSGPGSWWTGAERVAIAQRAAGLSIARCAAAARRPCHPMP